MPAKKSAKETPAKKRGQPTKFTPAMIEQARMLCEEGFTDVKLAKFFGVTEQTINNWKIKHPSFFESLKAGKDAADTEVEKSLFHRARGYSHPDSHVSNFQGSITVTPITKHYPPDTTACIFWLKNRKPAEWRDKQEIEHSGNVSFESMLAKIDSAGLPANDEA